MTIQPLISVAPQKPSDNSYDPANPSAPYGVGYLYSWGGHSSYADPWRIGDQFNNNEIIVGEDAVPLDNQDLYAGGDHPWRRCTIRFVFSGFNVTTENQYLLLFDMRGIWGDPTAQFFVGTDLVSKELLTGNEQHAILLDCPGAATYVYVHVRLASPNSWAAMGFKGVDCHLL